MYFIYFKEKAKGDPWEFLPKKTCAAFEGYFSTGESTVDYTAVASCKNLDQLRNCNLLKRFALCSRVEKVSEVHQPVLANFWSHFRRSKILFLILKNDSKSIFTLNTLEHRCSVPHYLYIMLQRVKIRHSEAKGFTVGKKFKDPWLFWINVWNIGQFFCLVTSVMFPTSVVLWSFLQVIRNFRMSANKLIWRGQGFCKFFFCSEIFKVILKALGNCPFEIANTNISCVLCWTLDPYLESLH